MQIKKVATEKAPSAIGPYSQAIVCGDKLIDAEGKPIPHPKKQLNGVFSGVEMLTLLQKGLRINGCGILVPKKLRDDILHALYKAVGLKTEGQGIAFSLPVDNAIGLFDGEIISKPQKTKESETETPEETETK